MNTAKYSASKKQQRLYASGFTLLELMVVVMIVAIFAAIAIPSYQSFIIRNGESVAQEKLLALSGSLERWRAKNLSYKSYVPSVDFISGQGYTAHTGWGNTAICIPSTADCDYKIRLFTTASGSSVGLGAANADVTRWQAIAIPVSSNLANAKAKKFYLNSQGENCYAKKSDTNYASFAACTAANAKW